MRTRIISRLGACLTAKAGFVLIACGLQASASTLAVTYSLAGALTSAPVATATTLTFDSASTVAVVADNPNLTSIWNPIMSTDHNVIDFTTGRNNATFIWKFADGNTLFGTLLEDVSKLDGAGAGPFIETFTFTGGTGEFALATGSVSGAGVGTATGFTSSGSGTINAPAVPEPASAELFIGGLAVILVAFRRLKKNELPSNC